MGYAYRTPHPVPGGFLPVGRSGLKPNMNLAVKPQSGSPPESDSRKKNGRSGKRAYRKSPVGTVRNAAGVATVAPALSWD